MEACTALRVMEASFQRNLKIFTECGPELNPWGPTAWVSFSAPHFRGCGAQAVLNPLSVSIPACQVRLKSVVRIKWIKPFFKV